MVNTNAIRDELRILSESEFAEYRLRLSFLFEDRNYWGGHLHEIKGFEVAATISFYNGFGKVKSVKCPHCDTVGKLYYGRMIIGEQRKIWCRCCCKTSVYKYK